MGLNWEHIEQQLDIKSKLLNDLLVSVREQTKLLDDPLGKGLSRNIENAKSIMTKIEQLDIPKDIDDLIEMASPLASKLYSHSYEVLNLIQIENEKISILARERMRSIGSNLSNIAHERKAMRGYLPDNHTDGIYFDSKR